ncbi:MAG: hypothetical protein U5Q44_04325 [Dehalococcoidia bacterium]|nr:hypothetical protein [Dehalococcoidia bacterium]
MTGAPRTPSSSTCSTGTPSSSAPRTTGSRRSRRDDDRGASPLDEAEPFGYVTIEGTAEIQESNLVDGHVALNRAMRNDPDWQPPEGFAERLESQGRVLIRVNAERVHGVTNRG